MSKRANRHNPEASAQASAAPDQAARDLITRELDRNMLVEAAAGTGKTTSLVARMINLIREGRCTIDKLAAVTFTRKAAAELRSRFQLGLERAAADADGNESRRLATAVVHIERAFIGTIHSFCARLLRERPVEAGVDPEFTELDDEKDAELRRRAWTEHVECLIAAADPLVAELEHLGLDIAPLRSAFGRFADYTDVVEWPADEISLPDPAPIIAAVATFAGRMQSLADTLPEDPGNDKLILLYRKFPRMVRQADLSQPDELYTLLERFSKSEPTLVQKKWPGGKAQALGEREAWNQFAREHAVPYVESMRAVRYSRVLKLLRPALRIYDRLRSDAGGLNFQDLLLIAAKMLREYPAIRRYFRERLTHLLVDEFQDTDPIQAEVMLLLTADDPHETDWRRCRPVNGSLFVVGDPKQSIYRFRRADIMTYNEVKRIIRATGGRVVSLSANFRTIAPIVEWVNGTFADRFPAQATDIAPPHAPFEVGRVDEREGEFVGLYLFTAPATNKDEILSREPMMVARTIRQALVSERTIPRSQREHDQPESAQPGDFLVVTRNTKNLSRYARELQELGVPHQVTGATSLNESEELSLLCTCLRALVRPDDPVALVGALRSELFGISDAALYAFKRSKGQFTFREPAPSQGPSPEDSAAIADAFGRLNRYYGWLSLLPAAASLEKIAADLGLFARAIASPGGDVRAGSLAKVVELVRSAAAKHLSAIDLLAYLDGLVGADQKHDGISVRPHHSAVVRVMNLHKVKGLEAPVVFLADPTGEFEHPIDLHVDRSGATARGYIAVYTPRPNSGHAPARLLAHPQDWKQLEETERAFQRAENDRLLYVAATRAGACLIVSHREKGANQNPWRPLVDNLSDPVPHQDPGPQVPPVRPRSTVSLEEIKAAGADVKLRWEHVRAQTYAIKPLKEVAPPRLRSTRAGNDEESLIAIAASDLEAAVAPFAGEHGVEWGEDLHVLLEAAMRKPDADIEGLARSLTRARDGDDDRVRMLVESVRATGRSEIWKRARASQRVLTEIPLVVKFPADEILTETVRRGVIDLAFLEPRGWVIVDYKTDLADPKTLPRLVEKYRPQVENYAETWGKHVANVHEFGLFFTRINCYLRVIQ